MKEMQDSDRNPHLGPTHWHVGNSGTDWPTQYSKRSQAKFNVGNSLIIFLYLSVGAIALRYILEIF